MTQTVLALLDIAFKTAILWVFWRIAQSNIHLFERVAELEWRIRKLEIRKESENGG